MSDSEGQPSVHRSALPLILLMALGLRLLHVVSSVGNPFFYALSADELYYLEFARDVTGGGWGASPGLNFMDPLYGYILAAMLWITGEDLFLVRLLQAVADTFSVFLIYRICKEFEAPRAGLFAALAYGICGPAIFYSALLLKTTWVASFCLLWIFLVLRGEGKGTWTWLVIGAFVSMCVLLRSNLLLLVPATIAWILWRNWPRRRLLAYQALAFSAGLVLAMSIGAVRQQQISGHWQWLPSNGGIFLYQVYNPQYIETRRVVPDFVLTSNPREVHYYFMAEAERRTGKRMTLPETNAYFLGEAVRHMRQDPFAVVRHLAANLASFVGGFEVPNNRSYYMDRSYSSILQLPVAGYSMLFALGCVGLVLGLLRDPRSLAVWIPIGLSLVTYTVFFDFSRFRFPAVPALAIGGGFLLDWLWCRVRERRWMLAGTVAATALVIFAISTGLGSRPTGAGIDVQQLARAQVTAGQFDDAELTISAALAENPGDAALYELLGFVAAQRGDKGSAIELYRRALALNAQRHVAWYNLSVAYDEPVELPQALEAIRSAISLRPLPEYRYRLAHLLESEDPDTARDVYDALLDELLVGSPLYQRVTARLELLDAS